MTPADRACEIEELEEILRYVETRLHISPLKEELASSMSMLKSALRVASRDLSNLKNETWLRDIITRHGGREFAPGLSVIEGGVR